MESSFAEIVLDEFFNLFRMIKCYTLMASVYGVGDSGLTDMLGSLYIKFPFDIKEVLVPWHSLLDCYCWASTTLFCDARVVDESTQWLHVTCSCIKQKWLPMSQKFWHLL